ncbi:MAG: TRAP transporter large permease [Burkholderiaceae bacterium]
MSAFLAIGLVVLLLFLRQPLLIILLCLAAAVQMIWGRGQLDYIVEDLWVALNKETILSIPMFLMCGGIMTRGSTARRLIRVAEALTCRVPGGLGAACILACMVFAAISGSSIVTMLAVGGIMLPAMKQAGYSERFSLGVVLAGGSLGVVLPPSVPLIIYGLVTETSIVDLFKAGLLPGLLLVVLFAGYAMWVNRRAPTRPFDWADLGRALREGVLAILMPVLLLGGIYSGYFSVTESAAVALAYALIVEVFVLKEMKLAELQHVVIDTAKLAGSLFPLLAVALSLALVLAEHRVPEHLVELLKGWFTNPYTFMITVNLLLLVVSCLMTTTEALLILGPLLAPVAAAYGYDKVFFGIIMIHNLEIGYLLPPLGINLLIAMTAFKQKLGELTIAAAPFLVLMVVGLALLVIFPWITLVMVR